jgi:hypothetical protein
MRKALEHLPAAAANLAAAPWSTRAVLDHAMATTVMGDVLSSWTLLSSHGGIDNVHW